jgi:diguanylate cyclase (GGDEF)-like protein
MRVIKDNDLPELPISMPLNFPGENYIKAIFQFVYLTISKMFNSVEEKHKLEERLLRMTALFDSQAFRTLSKNPELMYRYILDTIEFVFGHTSAALMVLDEASSAYKTAYSTGKYKDAVLDLHLDKDDPVINEMLNTKSSVFYGDLAKDMTATQLMDMESSHFFPIFIGDILEGVIGVFDRKFSRKEVKILNAFKDYIQLNLENQNLRVSVSKSKKADEKLAYLMDLSNSIVSILDKETLLNTLLEKSLQLLNAEQGSLMLLDRDTSELVVEAKRSIDDTVQEKMRIKKGEGISGMVLEAGGSLIVEDIERDPRIRQENRPRYRSKSFMSVPIKIEDRLTGILNVSDKIKGDVFDEGDLNLIESLIDNAAIAIERSILYDQTENLQKLSITDHLTGIYNRRYLNRRLIEEITRYNRYRHPFSFMMLDMDKFKEYNDTFGHIAGDDLLRNLAKIMEKSLRTVDIAARFGGDEFVAIFPQTPKVDAIQITNRLKEKIDQAMSEQNIETPLSVSMGLATFPDDASSIMELIEKTDQALYLAKKGGGNRVVYL